MKSKTEAKEAKKAISTHEVVLQFVEPPAAEVPVGSEITLKLRVICAAGCDVAGAAVRLMSGDEILREIGSPSRKPDGTDELPGAVGSPSETPSESAEAPLRAPVEVGTYSWTVLFPRQEINGVVHEEASVPVAFVTKPHESSLAIWDVPPTVVAGEKFKVKVGARSSGACTLKGTRIEVLNSCGEVAGKGELGDTPWQGTAALYWTEIELTAPAETGRSGWSARYGATDSELPHKEASAGFGFTVVPPPEHKLTVKIVEQETENPIENVQVRLGPFRSATDASGLAELSMPKGTYEMSIWHAKWESAPMKIEICEDTTIQVQSTPVPEDDPDAQWSM